MKALWGEVAAATRGRILAGDPSLRVGSWSIDSRTLEPGACFFAIVGPRHDGHDFLAAAVDAGAAAVVVSDASAAQRLAGRAAVVVVEDTTRALQDLAADVRDRAGAAVLAVTGSVGKTTTTALAALLLSGDRPTHATPGNLNNHYGLPLALLRMPEGTKAAVLEMGISTPGEMDRLVEIARPDLGLVTRIASAHVGNFSSLDELADEKMKLPRGSARALLNVDDPAQWARRGQLPDEPVPFGGGEAAEPGLRLHAIATRGIEGVTVDLAWRGARFRLASALAGRHQAENLAAAAALALTVGVPVGTVVERAAEARAQPGRGRVLRLGLAGEDAVVVDDSYNANPVAMRAAVTLLAETPAKRRVLVAGDMRELGAGSDDEHRALGRFVAERAIDVLLAVGRDAALAAETARAAGVEAHVVDDAEAAGRWLGASLRAGDVVLVKGSRGVALDRALASLDLEPRPPVDERGAA